MPNISGDFGPSISLRPPPPGVRTYVNRVCRLSGQRTLGKFVDYLFISSAPLGLFSPLYLYIHNVTNLFSPSMHCGTMIFRGFHERKRREKFPPHS